MALEQFVIVVALITGITGTVLSIFNTVSQYKRGRPNPKIVKYSTGCTSVIARLNNGQPHKVADELIVCIQFGISIINHSSHPTNCYALTTEPSLYEPSYFWSERDMTATIIGIPLDEPFNFVSLVSNNYPTHQHPTTLPPWETTYIRVCMMHFVDSIDEANKFISKTKKLKIKVHVATGKTLKCSLGINPIVRHSCSSPSSDT